jgi:hypothetical protein
MFKKSMKQKEKEIRDMMELLPFTDEERAILDQTPIQVESEQKMRLFRMN